MYNLSSGEALSVVLIYSHRADLRPLHLQLQLWGRSLPLHPGAGDGVVVEESIREAQHISEWRPHHRWRWDITTDDGFRNISDITTSITSPAVLHISKSVNRPWGVLLDIRKSCITPFVAPERAVWCSHVMSQSIWRCGVRNKRAFQTFLIRSSSLCLRLEATCVQTPGLTLVPARQAWHATH